MLLKDKVAVIYGTGGIGRGIALAFSREGASLFLANRSRSKAEEFASDLGAAFEQLDATDAASTTAYVDDVVRKAGRIDISFNVIGIDDAQTPLMDIEPEDFLRPISKAMKSQFATTRAAARHT